MNRSETTKGLKCEIVGGSNIGVKMIEDLEKFLIPQPFGSDNTCNDIVLRHT